MQIYGQIYLLYNNINGKAYIGQTINFELRMRGHRYASKKQIPSRLIDKKIKQYGWDNFDKLIIASAYNKEHLDELEIYYIDYYKTQVQYGNGYNVKEGGARGKHSEESKKKMSEVQTGHPVAETTKKKISKSTSGVNHWSFGIKGDAHHNWGRLASIETKQKMSKSRKGKPGTPHTEETKKQLSKIHSGRKRPEGSGSPPNPIKCIETNICFESERECARKMNLPQSSLNHHLKKKFGPNRYKNVKGYTFVYLNKENL